MLTNAELHAHLKAIDPESAALVHPNNRYRVLRAIQIFEKTGKRKSEHRANQKPHRSWVKSRLMQRREGKELPSIIPIDTSNPNDYIAKALEKLSDWQRGVNFYPEKVAELDADDYYGAANRQHYCELCGIMVQSDASYQKHLEGKKHKAMKKRSVKPEAPSD
ncbi:unnamed protein product, partial [Mesorhabditis spiculigera]